MKFRATGTGLQTFGLSLSGNEQDTQREADGAAGGSIAPSQITLTEPLTVGVDPEGAAGATRLFGTPISITLDGVDSPVAVVVAQLDNQSEVDLAVVGQTTTTVGVLLANPVIGHTVELNAGDQIVDLNFGNRAQPGEIRGFVFSDVNDNGQQDVTEPGLQGWTVFLDLDADGIFDLDQDGNPATNDPEPSRVTDERGEYVFTELLTRTDYRVGVDLKTGFIRTTLVDNSGSYAINLEAGQTRNDVSFGVRPDLIGSSGDTGISGYVFLDANNNGTRDPGEGKSGVVVYLDLNNNGIRDNGEVPATTREDAEGTPSIDEAGLYEFFNLPPAAYSVRLDLTAGSTLDMRQTSPVTNQFSRNTYAADGGPQSVTVGDFNGDGAPDFAVANQDTSNVSLLLQLNGSFQSVPNGEIDLGLQRGFGAFAVVTADLNGDHKDDLVVANAYSRNVSVMINNNGSFDQAVNYTTGISPRTVIAVDLDGDGNVDLVTANEAGNSVSIMKNLGGGTFANAVSTPLGSAALWVTAADLYGDARPELVVTLRDRSQLAILQDDGSGNYVVHQHLDTGRFPLSVTAADFDGDQHADLAVTNFLDNSVSVMRNNGNGTFAATESFATDAGPAAIVAVDLEMDGDIDLAVTHQVISGQAATDSVSLLRNDGMGRFFSPESAGVARIPDGTLRFSIAAADVDNDGINDLIVADKGLERISLLKNQLVASAAQVQLTADADVTATNFTVVLVDETPPTPVLSSTETSPTRVASIPVSVDFGEVVTGFEESDIVVAGGSVSGFATTDDQHFQFNVVPSSDGTITVDIPADVVEDVAENSSLAATQFSISSDRTVPLLTISPNNLTVAPGDVTFTFQFSEAVSGFSGSSVSISSGSKGTFTAVDADTYTLLVTPAGVDPVTVSVAADVAQDAAGNLNASVTADVAFAGFLVTQSDGSTVVTENGSTDTVSVVLTSRPQTNVVLMVSSEDSDEASVSSAMLTFTPQNWNTPQIVTITGKDDVEADQTQNTKITVAVVKSSSDDAFDSLADQPFTASTTDNEVVTVSLDEDGSLRITDSSTAGLAENLTLVFVGDELVIFDSTNVLVPVFGSFVSDHEVRVALAAITGQRIIADLRNGNDRLNADAVTAAFAMDVTAGPGNDTITGGAGSDTIDGGAGDDSILAGAGDDVIAGGEGSNDLTGGGGTDTLLVVGNSSLWITDTDASGSGSDAHSGFERAILEGGAGNNRLDARQATIPVTLLGQSGNDTLLGGSGVDRIDGGDGIDYAAIVGSNIVLTDSSAPGPDGDSLVSVEGLLLIAATGPSSIDASAYTLGPVIIVGSSANDTLKGGSGDDLILAGAGGDLVSGGGGADFISGGPGRDTITGDAGSDSIFGGGGNDDIDGGADADILSGGGGRDTIRGGNGADFARGGGGRDLIDGNDGADTLFGGGGADNLAGGLGADRLNGVDRDDTYNQQIGRDTLIGGNRPSERRIQDRPALEAGFQLQPASVEVRPTAKVENRLLHSPPGYTEEIDEAFMEPLIPELLEL